MKSDNFVPDSPVVGHTPDFKELYTNIFYKIKNTSNKTLDFVFNKIFTQDTTQFEEKHEDKLIEAVRTARNEWLIAKANFLLVSDQDLVDQAIYTIAAAEKKYLYLLKIARQENISADLSNVDIDRMRFKAREFNK